MKILVELIDKKQIQAEDAIYGYLFGTIYSIGTAKVYKSMKQLISLVHSYGQIVAVDMGKIIHEKELDSALKKAREYLAMGVDLILYTDMAFRCLGFEILLYSANTYLTNKSEIVGKCLLSSELSYEELGNILSNTDDQFVYGFGRPMIYYSRRLVLSNFKSSKDLSFHTKGLTLQEEFRKELYPVREFTDCSIVYHSKYYSIHGVLPELSNYRFNLFLSFDELSVTEVLKIQKRFIDFIKLGLPINLELETSTGMLYRKSLLTKGEV